MWTCLMNCPCLILSPASRLSHALSSTRQSFAQSDKRRYASTQPNLIVFQANFDPIWMFSRPTLTPTSRTEMPSSPGWPSTSRRRLFTATSMKCWKKDRYEKTIKWVLVMIIWLKYEESLMLIFQGHCWTTLFRSMRWCCTPGDAAPGQSHSLNQMSSLTGWRSMRRQLRWHQIALELLYIKLWFLTFGIQNGVRI